MTKKKEPVEAKKESTHVDKKPKKEPEVSEPVVGLASPPGMDD